MIMLCRKLELQLAEDILFSPLLKEHEKYNTRLNGTTIGLYALNNLHRKQPDYFSREHYHSSMYRNCIKFAIWFLTKSTQYVNIYHHSN